MDRTEAPEIPSGINMGATDDSASPPASQLMRQQPSTQLRARKILIIRRENIGDLVLTTPLIRALRTQLPDAYIAALVNTYNAPVLEGNPDVNRIYTYTKGKHAGGWLQNLLVRWQYLQLLLRLRAEKFDDVILGEPTYTLRNIRLARFVLAGRAMTRIIGFEDDDGTADGIDVVASKKDIAPLHMAEILMRLGGAYGVPAAPAPNARLESQVPRKPRLKRDGGQSQPLRLGLRLGLHISARKPSQRWSVESFADLAVELAKHGFEFRLFWSPGSGDNALHPGDDDKAELLLKTVSTKANVVPVPTTSLRALIDGLAEIDMLVCADGGAMHVAAALGVPVVALFGDSPPDKWHPWGVEHHVLQTPQKDVNQVTPEEVASAVLSLRPEPKD